MIGNDEPFAVHFFETTVKISSYITDCIFSGTIFPQHNRICLRAV
jgi:hypothetical protein